MTAKRTRRKNLKPGDSHYIDHVKLSEELGKYSRKYREAEAEGKTGDELPRINDYLGLCFIIIAERLATSHNFRNYSYKDEMLSAAIVSVVKYCKNYNNEAFPNSAFSYLTTIIYNSFVQVIKTENKKHETNLKMIQNAELECFYQPGMETVANNHSVKIADQKLKDKEESRSDSVFKNNKYSLRSGYTKKSREEFKKNSIEKNKSND
jgi:hypothetical protein